MNKADMLIRVRPELSQDICLQLLNHIQTQAGVLNAEFKVVSRLHSFFIEYNSDTIESMTLLNIVRTRDPAAVRISL